MRGKFGKVLKLVLGHKMPIRGDCPHEGSDIVIPTGLLSTKLLVLPDLPPPPLPPGEGKPHPHFGHCLFRRGLNSGCHTFILEKTVTSVMLPGEICPFPRDIALDSLPMASPSRDRKKCRQWHSVLEGY